MLTTMRRKAYIIIGDSFTFPEGDAATNRVFTYARGFFENSIATHVVAFRDDYLPYHNGEIEGVKYYHPFARAERSPYFVVRRLHQGLKYINTYRLFARIHSSESIHQVIVYSPRLRTHVFAWMLSRIFQAKLVKETSEHPFRWHTRNRLTLGLGYLKFKIESGLSDGIICISTFLINFYRERGVGREKLILVPSTVDPRRFSMRQGKPLPYRYIGYFGALTFKRDNVDVLIKAFARLTIRFPDFHLVLGGIGTDMDRKDILTLVKDLQLTNKVNLLDFMPRDEITKYITGADILVMVRSKGLESQASFPSKLTEYLASARPLISVDVGEISDYLSDGVNAFLVPAGDFEVLSEKIAYIIRNFNDATKIALEGRKLTDTVFNYHYQAERIIRFVEALRNPGIEKKE